MLKTIVHDSEVADIIVETLPFMALFTFFEGKLKRIVLLITADYEL